MAPIKSYVFMAENITDLTNRVAVVIGANSGSFYRVKQVSSE
jgi:hypothetical protein